jgi:hypothetical protein
MSGGTSVDDLCRAGVSRIPSVVGGSVAVMGIGMNRRAMYATDEVAQRVDDFQFEFGEGPCMDAFTSGGPVLIDDLTGSAARLRWPMFTAAASDAGVAAIFAFPLQVGAVKFGVLDLYGTRAGPLTPSEFSDALVLGDALTLRLLATGDGGDIEADLGDDPRAVVHQATGMITVQLGVGVEESLARLRGYAYAAGRSLGEVAADVVDRRLRFDELHD